MMNKKLKTGIQLSGGLPRSLFLLFLSLSVQTGAQDFRGIPRLEPYGTTSRLLVDDKPFLILGGELGNSSSSATTYMKEIWPVLEENRLNTVLAPVYWELIEPEEGKYDFTLVRDLISDAREHDMRLVLLWFASWKNSMSCYAPSWVKRDYQRFPRARDRYGDPVEILSPFERSNLVADKMAFVALMKFIRDMDSEEHTVIMIQVENEIGMLPDARDHSPAANMAFEREVPADLIKLLRSDRTLYAPELRSTWVEKGRRTRGAWPEVFGTDPAAEELFMAWHYARYVEEITAAGKAVYPLPMYVNAALNRPGRLPGQYPSAGPLPHLMDLWKLAAPSLDLLAPDIYFADFEYWASQYNREGNPLFLPEVRYEQSPGIGYETACGPKAFFAFGNLDALGFSPFFIESTSDMVAARMTEVYTILNELSPLILAGQGTGQMKGFLFDRAHSSDTVLLGGYRLIVKHDYSLGWSAGSAGEVWPVSGGLVICTGEGEYMVAGEGIVMTFPAEEDGTRVGIEQIDEVRFREGEWTVIRRLNGDQSHQGRHLRISMGRPEIQYLKLYRYH